MENRRILRRLPSSLKILITVFVLSLAVGYSISLLQVFNRTGVQPAQTVRHYRGADSQEGALFLPQSYGTLLSVSHVHSFSQPVVLGLLCLLFALTGSSERAKIIWILVSFFGSFTSLAGPWLVRYLASGTVYLLYVGGTAMFVSFAVMFVGILREVWSSPGGTDV